MNNKRKRKINFSAVLEKLQALSEGMDMQIVTINATVPANNVLEMAQVLVSLVQLIEETGIKVTDAVLSPRGEESTISLTCEVSPMLPISKDVRNELMMSIKQNLGIMVNILK